MCTIIKHQALHGLTRAPDMNNVIMNGREVTLKLLLEPVPSLPRES